MKTGHMLALAGLALTAGPSWAQDLDTGSESPREEAYGHLRFYLGGRGIADGSARLISNRRVLLQLGLHGGRDIWRDDEAEPRLVLSAGLSVDHTGDETDGVLYPLRTDYSEWAVLPTARVRYEHASGFHPYFQAGLGYATARLAFRDEALRSDPETVGGTRLLPVEMRARAHAFVFEPVVGIEFVRGPRSAPILGSAFREREPWKLGLFFEVGARTGSGYNYGDLTATDVREGEDAPKGRRDAQPIAAGKIGITGLLIRGGFHFEY